MSTLPTHTLRMRARHLLLRLGSPSSALCVGTQNHTIRVSRRGVSSLIENRYLHTPCFDRINHVRSNTTSTKCSYSNHTTPTVLEEDIQPHKDSPPLFSKILIANRGEIARRIIRTCRSHNIATVAVYSTEDSKCPFVMEADEAICVGPATSADSYLNIDNICQAIRQSGCEAVHPGYGFLSENSDFAKRVAEMNVKFIGPSSEAIDAMGDKITSKRIAMEAKVNIIPGFDGFVNSADEAVQITNDVVGYPVMIKATSGGGGKGMRICYTEEELREAFVLSKAEAKAFFNDERLFLESFIPSPHHIEIQLLAGRKTTDGIEGDLEIVCFAERECSIQRRNQKVLEESPSTLLTEETRKAMVAQVKSLVRKVDYQSAGTVEFLVDEKQNFYFLEMNTRLQVEHPVTEMVSGGVDLVHGMISVAAGKGIPPALLKEQMVEMGNGEDEGIVIPYHGHAIEARIYAEDPYKNHLPSTGHLRQYIEPSASVDTSFQADKSTAYIRIDSGVVKGQNISPYYDPMISKLIAYSPKSRRDAIRLLGDAIDKYVIQGVGNNTPFIRDLLRHPEFRSGNTPTNFIDVHYPEGFTGVHLSEDEHAEMAAISFVVSTLRAEILQQPPLALMKTESSSDQNEVIVCLGGLFGDSYIVRKVSSDSLLVKKASSDSNSEPIEVNIQRITFDINDPIVQVEIDGKVKTAQIQRENETGMFIMKYCGSESEVILMSPEEYHLSRYMKEPTEIDNSDFIQSPMPGRLVSFHVQEGDNVEIGQEICTIEAMKMQNIIRSTRSGKIKTLRAQEESSLMADEVIAEFVQEDTQNIEKS